MSGLIAWREAFASTARAGPFVVAGVGAGVGVILGIADGLAVGLGVWPAGVGLGVAPPLGACFEPPPPEQAANAAHRLNAKSARPKILTALPPFGKRIPERRFARPATLP
jgi:hypothetical protein